MRSVYKRNTGRIMCRMSFIDEQKNIDTVKKILDLYVENDVDYNNYIDFEYSRAGQDVRYSVDDSKLKSLGWKPTAIFDDELPAIVNFYKDNFIW